MSSPPTLLWEEEFVVALPVGNHLCARPRITFEEVAAEDLIAWRRAPPDCRGQGLPEGRAGLRGAHRATHPARGLSKVGRCAERPASSVPPLRCPWRHPHLRS